MRQTPNRTRTITLPFFLVLCGSAAACGAGGSRGSGEADTETWERQASTFADAGEHDAAPPLDDGATPDVAPEGSPSPSTEHPAAPTEPADTNVSQPTSKGLKCAGVPVRCDDRAEVFCAPSLGCVYSEQCTGIPRLCVAYDRWTCSDQPGCETDADGECFGWVMPCSLRDSLLCGQEQGCSLTSSCTGRAIPCEELTPESCLRQPGCSLRW
jgi:hypothetical protein